MYGETDYAYDVFLSYPWLHPEGKWVMDRFLPALQGELRHAFPDWEPRIFVAKDEFKVGDPLEAEIREALLGSCVLVPVLCYPYFRRPWCAAEWRSFRAPAADATQRYGRARRLAPTIYAGDPSRFPPQAREASGLLYCDLRRHTASPQRTRRFTEDIQALAASIAALMSGENDPPDARWPAFTGPMMEDLLAADAHGEGAQWMLVGPPVIRKPTFSPAA